MAAVIAEQFGRAKQYRRAIDYHLAAAQQASVVFANKEATRQCRRGVDLLPRLPAGRHRDRMELKLRHAMSAPINAQFGYASNKLRGELERSVELAEKLSDEPSLLWTLAGLFAVRYVQGNVAESFRIAERALELGERWPDAAGQAHFAYGGAATSLGRHAEALPHFEASHMMSIDHPPSVVGTRPEVHGRAWSAHTLWLLGRSEEAVEWSDWAIERAQQAEHPYSHAVALAYSGITHQLRRDVERTAESARKTQEICARYGFAYYCEWGVILEGWCMGGHAGIDQISRGVQSLRDQGALVRQPYYLGLLAETLLASDRDDQARAALDAALAAVADHDDRWWEAELYRLKSRTLDGAKADAMLRHAREVADAQGAVALRDRLLSEAPDR